MQPSTSSNAQQQLCNNDDAATKGVQELEDKKQQLCKNGDAAIATIQESEDGKQMASEGSPQLCNNEDAATARVQEREDGKEMASEASPQMASERCNNKDAAIAGVQELEDRQQMALEASPQLCNNEDAATAGIKIQKKCDEKQSASRGSPYDMFLARPQVDMVRPTQSTPSRDTNRTSISRRGSRRSSSRWFRRPSRRSGVNSGPTTQKSRVAPWYQRLFRKTRIAPAPFTCSAR